MKIQNDHKRWFKALRPVLLEIIERQREELQDCYDAFGGQMSTFGIEVAREHRGRREMLKDLPSILDKAFEFKSEDQKND